MYNRRRYEQIIFVDGKEAIKYVGFYKKDTMKRGQGSEGYIKRKIASKCSHLDFYSERFSGLIGEMLELCRGITPEEARRKEMIDAVGKGLTPEEARRKGLLIEAILNAEDEIRALALGKKTILAEEELKKMHEEAEENQNGEE